MENYRVKIFKIYITSTIIGTIALFSAYSQSDLVYNNSTNCYEMFMYFDSGYTLQLFNTVADDIINSGTIERTATNTFGGKWVRVNSSASKDFHNSNINILRNYYNVRIGDVFLILALKGIYLYYYQLRIGHTSIGKDNYKVTVLKQINY